MIKSKGDNGNKVRMWVSSTKEGKKYEGKTLDVLIQNTRNGLKQRRAWQVDRPSACQGHKKPWEQGLKERFESNFQTKNKTRLHDSKQEHKN